VLRIYIDDKELKFVEDFDILKKSIDYAIDNNLDFSMLKVHCTETNEAIDAFIDSEGNNFWDKYVIKVKDAAEKLIDNKEKTRLCIFNEMKTFYLEEKYEALMSASVNKLSLAGFNVGISFTWIAEIYDAKQQIIDSCNWIGVNMYPKLTNAKKS